MCEAVKCRPAVYYINEKRKSASRQLAFLLETQIAQLGTAFSQLVILCIGSDRVTGDSLGPFIGRNLSRYRWRRIAVYGTLENPVHALNLTDTLKSIKKEHPQSLIVAIDASLGLKKHIGYITLGRGSLQPGAGVGRDLPAVGDLFITGILCPSGTFERFYLQNTRLARVVSMADAISAGLAMTCEKIERKEKGTLNM